MVGGGSGDQRGGNGGGPGSRGPDLLGRAPGRCGTRLDLLSRSHSRPDDGRSDRYRRSHSPTCAPLTLIRSRWLSLWPGAGETTLRLILLEAAALLRERWEDEIEGRSTASALLDAGGRVIARHGAHELPGRLELDPAVYGPVTLPDGRVGELQALEGGGAILWLSRRRLRSRPPRLRLRLLGPAASAQLESASPERALRSLELLAVLAMYPEGLTAEQLALALYGERGKTVTIRAQVHRVRAHLGKHTLQTQPYRLLDGGRRRLAQRATTRVGRATQRGAACVPRHLAASFRRPRDRRGAPAAGRVAAPLDPDHGRSRPAVSLARSSRRR